VVLVTRLRVLIAALIVGVAIGVAGVMWMIAIVEEAARLADAEDPS
jgi:hypothetical protein